MKPFDVARLKPHVAFVALFALSIAIFPAASSGESAYLPLPEAVRVVGIPPIPREQAAAAQKYTRLGGTSFRGWHPQERAMLASVKSGETTQLSLIPSPGARRQTLTRGKEPVSAGAMLQSGGRLLLVYQHDTGGNERFQLSALDVAAKKTRLLTDGKSRNIGQRFSHSGQWAAYTSTRRNGRDTDVLITSIDGKVTRTLVKADSPGWNIHDWSSDDKCLLVGKGSAGTWRLVTVADGRSRSIKKPSKNADYSRVRFAENDEALYAIADIDEGARRALVRVDLKTGKQTEVVADTRWDVESYAISADGRTIAYVVNEDSFSKLRLFEIATKRDLPVPDFPKGTIAGGSLEWHPKLREVGFSMNSAQSSSSPHSLDADTGKLTAWRNRKNGAAMRFSEPELAHIESFDGLKISALVYRPDPVKFPGPRPVIVLFHGGPASQSRPGFLGRNNYYIDELGIALVYPNVRGSTGYGREFSRMDNGYKREDSVKDAGAVFEWIRKDRQLDGARIAVMGGSYGGYMALATMVRYNGIVRCGVDSVGISNFVTFLKNTADYRRDSRRKEYGDERDGKMRAFLEKIAPANNADKIRAPLLIIQGENDPRVPLGESETMRDQILKRKGTVWYLGAANEGHGFKKTSNSNYQFHATVLFFKKYLLGGEE